MSNALATLVLAAMLGAGDSQWMQDYGTALNAARTDKRPLLVVLHKPQDPKQGIRQVSQMRNSEQLALLRNYHLCQVDITTDEGKQIAKRFQAKSFPYTVITDKTAEKIVFTKSGGFSDGEWTTTLADYRRGEQLGTLSGYQFGVKSTSQPCLT